ncbi:uncharacterized protein LOC131233524 isoform X2 [Magnolia sinica]|uniref:uncharacterized protein LOC131233524 isoform X2 n=1 Tax=Magnolia sinica TaxID=86752 RepID=UPI002657F0A2|nr:uncharacterized protein LOC131233524 isoform X2 [Magnolia sinica]
MAVCPEEKVYPHMQGIADRSHEFPLRCCSSIPPLKPGADAATHSYCLDVLPVLLDEASIPVNLTCPYGSSQGQGFYGVSGVLEKGNISPESPSQLTFLSFLEVPYPSESQTCSDVHWNCSNHINLQIESADKCQLCGVGVEIQDGCLQTPKINDETVGSPMRSEAPLNSALSIKGSLQLGGKMMQFLMDHSATLLRCTSRDKCNNEKGYDTSNNKWRRYKRSASFNSRRIVLFSSILSSMGTMVLIYLTLRVKQISDGLVHV